MLSTSPPSMENILLADDDRDDCLFFKEAVEDLQVSAQLTTVYNGEQLMQHLYKENRLPDIIFLDLNMPRKNGFKCLSEIKQDENLKELPVVIISTSYDPDIVNLLYSNGARFYIRKPVEFSSLKNLISRAITLSTEMKSGQPPRERFVLSKESYANEPR